MYTAESTDTNARVVLNIHTYNSPRFGRLEDSDYESDESISLEEELGVERACYMRSVIAKGNILGMMENIDDLTESEDDEEEDTAEMDQEDNESEFSDEEILPVELRSRCSRNFPRRNDEYDTDDDCCDDVGDVEVDNTEI